MYYIVSFCIVSYRFVSFCIVLNRFESFCIVLYRFESFRIVSYCTCMGLWTKLRRFGHGDAEPGLEAAEEMLQRDEEIK